MHSFSHKTCNRHVGAARYSHRERHSAVREHRQLKTEKHRMKLNLTLAALTLTLFAAFAFSGCANGSSAGGSHQMGSPKTGYQMSNQNMPGR